MTAWTGAFLPMVALAWPLLLATFAALPPVRSRAVRLLPLAPLPALQLALAGAEGVTAAPDLLLGVTLGLDPAGRLLLGMTAALWLIAGLAAQPMAGQVRSSVFVGFWCLTLAGNVGVLLAADVLTFYVAFAAVSLASWYLVVHDGTPAALGAGRVYIVLAISGEVALLTGLLIGVDAAGGTGIAAVRAALGETALGPLAVTLLVAGFGIKAGLVPLHVWLPLAHPAAPVPASAVLSGAIVKAGLWGMLVFLPPGAAGQALVGLGLAGAFGAALWGLTQRNPKAVLAYSTVSQMGLMAMLVGAGGAARDMAPFFALHHGFAKGALFLLVGAILSAGTDRQRVVSIAIAGVVAASIAGAPLTGGAVAKAAVKPALAGWLAPAMSLSSFTTALLLVWFLRILATTRGRGSPAPGWTRRLLFPAAAGGLAIAAPWALWPDWTGRAPDYLLTPDAVAGGVWPLALALAVALVLRSRALPERPPGDLLCTLARLRPRQVHLPVLPAPPVMTGRTLARLLGAVAAAERRLLPWSVGGMLLSSLAVILLVLLAAAS
ncbi:MAG: proton-conducting transporter membrane subunit [Rhodovibrio sp.]|nr:proton-conducting transporter membrane subunit [Rhodovibrio sp.]